MENLVEKLMLDSTNFSHKKISPVLKCSNKKQALGEIKNVLESKKYKHFKDFEKNPSKIDNKLQNLTDNRNILENVLNSCDYDIEIEGVSALSSSDMLWEEEIWSKMNTISDSVFNAVLMGEDIDFDYENEKKNYYNINVDVDTVDSFVNLFGCDFDACSKSTDKIVNYILPQIDSKC